MQACHWPEGFEYVSWRNVTLLSTDKLYELITVSFPVTQLWIRSLSAHKGVPNSEVCLGRYYLQVLALGSHQG